MKQRTMSGWLIGLVCITVSSACTVPEGNGDGPVGVENRVNIGENTWIVEYGSGSRIAEAGTIESFEIVNSTTEDISVPDAGLDNSTFRIIVNQCRNAVLKPGASCTVRGEWAAKNAREATLNVVVSKPNAENPATEKISVPLEASPGSTAPPKKTVSPTPGPTFTTSPSPTETSTESVTPTPSGPTTSGSPVQSPSGTATR